MLVSRVSIKVITVVTIQIAIIVTSNDASAGRFGLHCTEDYQNAWADALPYSWERCNRFSAKLDELDTLVFNYNLQGKASYWHDSGDQCSGSLEDVELFFANTHGGITEDGTAAAWTMWDTQTWAWANQMRLGDEAYTLSIFATYSCDTHRTSDGGVVDRWSTIFDGGLRYALGSHGTLWSGYTTSEVAEEFAIGLQQQKVLKNAWHDGLTDWYYTQDISALVTGANDSDCSNRRDTMTWQNFIFSARLRDWDWGTLCWTQWHE